MNHCPACGENNWGVKAGGKLRFSGGGDLEWYVCRGCSHRWLSTDPEIQARIESHYNRRYAGFRQDETFSAVVRRELNGNIRRLAPMARTVLDVGCGNGQFMSIARQCGYECVGIDVSVEGVRLCRERGLVAVAADFLNHEYSQRFDLVTFWDVVEHLRCPLDFLVRARSVLGPGGAIVLKIPGFEALHFALLRIVPGRAGLILGAPEHVQYFTRKSLGCLLERSGFSEVTWLPSLRFRSLRLRDTTLRSWVAHHCMRFVNRVSGASNLYCIARTKCESLTVSSPCVNVR
jgi:SAM-dependent methyltransferase